MHGRCAVEVFSKFSLCFPCIESFSRPHSFFLIVVPLLRRILSTWRRRQQWFQHTRIQVFLHRPTKTWLSQRLHIASWSGSWIFIFYLLCSHYGSCLWSIASISVRQGFKAWRRICIWIRWVISSTSLLVGLLSCDAAFCWLSSVVVFAPLMTMEVSAGAALWASKVSKNT